MKGIIYILLLCTAFIIAVACTELLPPAPEPETVLAGPIEDLTPQQLRDHLVGDEQFGRIFSQEDGLGPIFVSNACESCHIGDGKGHPLTTLTRFGKYSGGVWDPMVEEGGPQLQSRAIAGYPPETIPGDATGVTRLMPPAVTGLGYLAAVPDAVILELADPDDSDDDGISGVPNYIQPSEYFIPSPSHIPSNGKYIGRFGKKAGAIDLLQQIVTAYKQDMGVTSDFDTQDIFNVRAGQTTGDFVDDPEVSAAIVNNVVFYVRTLKVPPRRDENDIDVIAGENLFNQINCSSCHSPSLVTGFSDVTALSNKTIHPYTDLLLHDMGSELDDGYTEGTALTSEWRTAPLWGIGLAEDSQGGSPFYLHDGRASTLKAAIGFHGGEASNSRDEFNNLSTNEKDQVIIFLKSL
jgi:CxxC motif-containing protein (DUF1111 family)